MIENKQKQPETSKSHRRKGGAFDTLSRVLRSIGEVLFRSGVVMRNRGEASAGTSTDFSPAESVFEVYNQKKASDGKFNLMFYGRNGKRKDYNTNYIELTSDIKGSDTPDPANGQVRLNLSRDGVATDGVIALLNSRLVVEPNTGVLSVVDGIRAFIHGSGNGTDDLGGVQLVYFNESGSPIHYLILDRDGVQLHGLPTSDPSISGALWNDSGTVKIST